MDGPESWLNVEPLHEFIFFSVNQLFFFCELQAVLTHRTSSVFFLWTSTVLFLRTSTVLTRRTSSILFLRTSTILTHRTSSVLFLWTSSCSYLPNFNCSYCCELRVCLLLRTSPAYYVELNFLFMLLYPVSRVYTILSTLDSALCCDSEIPLLIFILWLCCLNILKERSPYLLIFCINFFTTSTINY